MKKVLLIFLSTVIIISIGIYFGFDIIEKKYEISEETLDLSEPFRDTVNKEYIESIKPAYEF